MFELGEDLLDRVQVGAIREQKEQGGTRRADGLAYGWALVTAKVVHHHYIAGAQRGGEDLLERGPEQVTVDSPVEDARRVDPV